MTTDAVGGVWTYSLDLARALDAYGVEIVLATMGPPPDDSRLSEARQLGNLSLRVSTYKLEWMEDPWQDVEMAARWLLDLEQQEQPDLVHLNGYVHGALNWNVPRVMVGHSCVLSWWEAVKGEPAPRSWARYRNEVRLGLQSAQVVLAPTRAMLDCLIRHYQLIGHTRVVPNGRDHHSFRPGQKRNLVFCAGRIWDEAKNAATLARAAKKISWPVCIAGDTASPEGQPLELPPGVTLLGRIGEDEMRQWMGEAWIYALPARYEPFGLSVLEAALSGCALVLGDIPTLREVWGDAALFVAPDDAGRLADAVNYLSTNAPVRSAMARRARDRARAYTLDRMAAAYLEAARDLLPLEEAAEQERVGAQI